MNAPSPRITTPVGASHLTVRGHMAVRAEVRTTVDGVAYLYALVRQSDRSALPILAAQRYGSTPGCHQAAHHKAAALHAGEPVVLYGGSLVVDRWLGEPVLLLSGDTEVQPTSTRALHEAAAA